MVQTKFALNHAKARLLPTAAQIVLASPSAQQTFLRVLADVRFTAGLSQAEEAREERLFTFYNVTGKTEVTQNASLICKILDEVFGDPNEEFCDVETDLAGLPVSILSRLFILHDEAIPALDGALLRVTAKELVKGHIFNPDSTNQIKTLLKDQRRRKLQTLARRSAKACATPSADSIENAKLFSGVFDTVFKNPDTLMLEVSDFCATHYGTQISIPFGQSPSVTLAAVLVKAGIDYEDTPFSDTPSDHNRLEIIFTIASRWMLRSRSVFAQASTPIPWPGVPTGASDLMDTLELVQDLNAEHELSPLALMGAAMKALDGYYTLSDSADDLALRVFFMLRFSGFTSHDIADSVKKVAEQGMDQVCTPQVFIDSFGTLPAMAPIQHAVATPVGVGPAAPKKATPFLSHQVEAANLSGKTINGYTLEDLRRTNGAPWINLRVLDKRGTAGIVTGTIASDSPGEVWYAVLMSDRVTDPTTTSAADVYKGHLAYQAQESAADFNVEPRTALERALNSTPFVRDSSGTHRSDQMLTTQQLNIIGASLGTPIPGAPSSVPTAYSGAQMDTIIAGQLKIPTSSRSSATQLQTLNWLNEVSSQFTSEGNVNEKYYDRRPAASTALNSIIEQLLTSLRKLHLEFFLNHHDIILMMRCKHRDLDLTRFQVQEPGVKKAPAFANTRTGLVLCTTAMRRAKSLEVGATEDHLAGWDHLITLGDKLVERGFALAEPQDFYDLVKETFTVFSMEHRDAINDSRDVSDYPTFDNLDDAAATIAPALEMLTKGNVMRKQVDKIVASQLALLTPSQKGGRKRGALTSPPSPASSSSPSPKLNGRQKKRAASLKRKSTQTAAKTAATKLAQTAAAKIAQAAIPMSTALTLTTPTSAATALTKAAATAHYDRLQEEKRLRKVAIGVWMKTPESKDKNGADRCFLHDQDPSWCPTPCQHGRSHEPAGP